MKKHITIIGQGRMGTGIALAFATRQYHVNLIDGKNRSDDEYGIVENNTRQTLLSNLQTLKKIDYLQADIEDILTRISLSSVLDRESLDGDVIFEAIPEKPELKIQLFQKISPMIREDVILASTTSTIDLKTLKRGLKNPQKSLITHWLNPAFIIPLVEVAVSKETDPETIEEMTILLESIDKIPVVLKDSPGFIVPRIQTLVMNEAARMVQEGIASPEDIDRAIKTGFAFRLSSLGMLEFVDLGGLDILYYAGEFLSEAFKEGRFKCPEIIKDKMQRGEIGPRTGKGIYDYTNKDINGLFEKKYSELWQLHGYMKKKALF